MVETRTVPIRRPLVPELQGGILSALASIPQTIPMGIIVFAPFGAAGMAYGITSAIIGALVGGILIGLIGPMKVQIAGPRSGSAMILAEFALWLSHQPAVNAVGDEALQRALPLIVLAMLLAGLLQLVAGATNLARYIKFLPLPVLSGFTLALGLGMMWATWPALFGLSHGDRLDLAALTPQQIGLAATFVATIVIYALAPRWLKTVPPIATAFLGGLLVALVVREVVGAPPGPSVALATFDPRMLILGLHWPAALALLAEPGFALIFAVFVVALALISSIESLLSVVACDFRIGSDTDANQELRAEGATNILVALCGGMTVSASLGRTSVNIAAQAQGPLSAFIAAGLCGLLLFADDPQRVFPESVMQGILFVIGVGLYDGRLGDLLRRVNTVADRRKGQIGEIVILAVTTATTLFIGATVGLGLGLAASVVVFLREMSRPVIQAETSGRQRRSRRTRPPAQAEYLFAHGAETIVAELEGPIFFGTADQIRRWLLARTRVSPHGPLARTVVLNLARTYDIDATGAAVLAQAVRRFTSMTGAAVGIAGLLPGDSRRRVLVDNRVEAACVLFDDLDAALEWAEERLLARAPKAVAATARREIPLVEGATPDQIRLLENHLEYRVIEPGELIFAQGDDGDALYFLEEGAIRIEWVSPDRVVRLATLTPGVVFGEMSLIDGAPRSAGARAEERSVVLRLSKDALEEITLQDPALAAQLMRSLAADIARRLRLANAALTEIIG